MSKPLKEIEHLLSANPYGSMPDKLNKAMKDRILKGLPVTGSATHAPERRKKLALIFTFAAAALVLIGLGILGPMMSKEKPSPEQTVGDLSSQPATDGFYVVNTEPENRAVIVQDFKEFHITRRLVGSKIGGFVLVKVDDNSIVLQDQAGLTRESLVTDLNAKAITELKAETSILQKRFQAELLDSDDMARLKNIAYFEGTGAFELLESVAASSSPLRGPARAALSGNQELKQIRLAVTWARRTGSQKSRRKAILGLGKTTSPLAIQNLKELAIDLEIESLALLCVDMLNQHDRNWTLGALEKVAANARFENVRNSAATAIQKILKDLKHD